MHGVAEKHQQTKVGFDKKGKQITRAQLPPSWGAGTGAGLLLSACVRGGSIDLLSSYLLPSRGVSGRRLPASSRQLCSSAGPVSSQRHLWRAGGITRAPREEWDKNILLFLVRWLTTYPLQIHCFESCGFPFTTHPALTVHSRICRTDAFPFSICIWKYASDSILVPAEPRSLSWPYSLCDAGASCISTKGKGKVQAQKEGRYLWRRKKKCGGKINKQKTKSSLHTQLLLDSGLLPSRKWCVPLSSVVT